MNRRNLMSSLAGCAAMTMGVPGSARAASVTSDGPNLVGQSAPFERPSAVLGKEMKQGMDASILAVSRAGGVHGRKIVLRSLIVEELQARLYGKNLMWNDHAIYALKNEKPILTPATFGHDRLITVLGKFGASTAP